MDGQPVRERGLGGVRPVSTSLLNGHLSVDASRDADYQLADVRFLTMVLLLLHQKAGCHRGSYRADADADVPPVAHVLVVAFRAGVAAVRMPGQPCRPRYVLDGWPVRGRDLAAAASVVVHVAQRIQLRGRLRGSELPTRASVLWV